MMIVSSNPVRAELVEAFPTFLMPIKREHFDKLSANGRKGISQ